MSVGSAFDAFVKSYMYERIHGTLIPEFERDTIFEQQVEKQHWDWAREAGEYVFRCYKNSGALADIMLEVEGAVEDPRFEFTVEGKVTHEADVEGIPLLGKPDIDFTTKQGMGVTLDWKVNGYCGKTGASPKKGYIKSRDSWNHEKFPQSRTHGKEHKDCQIMMVGGLMMNVATGLESVDKTWARQTCIYCWLLGREVGSRFGVGIDQISSNGSRPGDKPLLRINTYRNKISEKFQLELWNDIKRIWGIIQSEWIFDELSREASDERCRILDDYHKAFQGDPEDKNEAWFTDVMRREW